MKTFIGILIVLSTIGAGSSSISNVHSSTNFAPAHTFGWKNESFLLDGKPFVIRSGEMHYPRVPSQYWRDRMRKMRAMGLNTICTYVFWNLHEPKPGQFDFSGNLDIAAFIRTAQEEGLWVIVRPGPYICTEWDFGGLPSWLLATPDMKVRSTDPRFLKASENYMQRVGRELVPLQITHGGPIIMTQVENEYGSFGNDHQYMTAIKQMIVKAGFDVTLYTSDGPGLRQLEGGTLPDTLSVINFGGGNPAAEFASFAKFRQNVPLMIGEYWIGWFDHWGEKHHTTPPPESAQGVEWVLSKGISFNLYMFHGGSTFGFMNGANFGRRYEPDISGYDYDSPLDEAGRPTQKFFAIRDVIKKHLPPGETLPEMPSPLPMIEIPSVELNMSAPLLLSLGKAIQSDRPQTMEALDQDYGFIVYRTKINNPIKGKLEITEARDYAVIFQGQKLLGTLDRRSDQKSIDVELNAGAPLNIVVENMGRVNFGPHLVDDHKGITEKVTMNGEELKNWYIYPLPLKTISGIKFLKNSFSVPAFHQGVFTLSALGDTFLDMRGWGKGVVWVNGHNLGRYWHIGPQQSLFVPAGWLKKGKNEIVVLDLESGGKRSIRGLKDPVYGN